MTDELDSNVELYPVWKQALVKFRDAGWTYGDIVPHSWFYEAFGLEIPDDKMPFEKVKKIQLARLSQFEPLQAALLEQYQMDLQPEPGQGYAVIPPSDQTKKALTDGMKAIKKAVRDMVDRGTNVNPARLTAEQRRENADILARMAMMRGMLRPPRALPPLDEE